MKISDLKIGDILISKKAMQKFLNKQYLILDIKYGFFIERKIFLTIQDINSKIIYENVPYFEIDLDCIFDLQIKENKEKEFDILNYI